MLFKIAWRNLLAEPRKTLIIGILVALAVMAMVVGNSAAKSMERSIENSYVENITGDIILRTKSEDPISFTGGFFNAPILDNYEALSKELDARDEIVNYTPVLHSIATAKKVLTEEDKKSTNDNSTNDNSTNDNSTEKGSSNKSELSDFAAFIGIWGINPEDYFDMFAGTYTLEEGEFWQEGETGVILSTGTREEFAEEGFELHVGDMMSFSSQNANTGTKIRRLPILGFGNFDIGLDSFDDIVFMDAGSLRYLAGLTLIKTSAAEASEAIVVDEDSFFGGGSLVTEEATNEETTANDIDFDNILGDTSVREKFLALDNSAWHFLLLETTDNINPLKHKYVLDKELTSSEGLEVESWRWGVNQILTVATGLQIILNVSVMIIIIVSIIIIMNTLVISVTERITEIGTIRAIGGQKGFVRRMIVTEVLTIMVVFGIIGILLGMLIVGAFNVIGIPANDSEFLQVIFGGKIFRPSLAFNTVWWSLLAVMLVGIAASLYPTSVALGISPARAMQKS